MVYSVGAVAAEGAFEDSVNKVNGVADNEDLLSSGLCAVEPTIKCTAGKASSCRTVNGELGAIVGKTVAGEEGLSGGVVDDELPVSLIGPLVETFNTESEPVHPMIVEVNTGRNAVFELVGDVVTVVVGSVVESQ
jgi:hypothetical protein